jgi:dnd system-associated protein 4
MRTLRYSKQYEGVVKQLGGDAHPLTRQPLFQTYRELACFAAVLGYESDTRLRLEGEQNDFVDGRIFGNYEPAVDLMYLVALASSRDMNILRDEHEDRMLAIFEEFANGGLKLLADWLHEKPDDAYGDKAVLAALYQHGFLTGQREQTAAEAASEVSF